MAPTMIYRYGWIIQPDLSLMLQSLRFGSRVALIYTFIAIGAVVRIGVDRVGDIVLRLAFGIVMKSGLSDTLSFVAGFTYGRLLGL